MTEISIKFAIQRISEQDNYITEVQSSSSSPKRKEELIASAKKQKAYFENIVYGEPYDENADYLQLEIEEHDFY